MMDPRDAYWLTRYETPDWQGGLHLGSFDDPSLSNELDLARASRAADTWLIRRVLEHCSIFRLVTGFRILDVGCGNTSLGGQFTALLTSCNYVGIDPSSAAINRARTENISFRNSTRCEYHQSGVVDLGRIAEKGQFDLIIVREMFYLLSSSERKDLVTAIRMLLRPGGMLHFSDMVMVDARDQQVIQRHLYDRHRAKGAILASNTESDRDIEAFLGGAFGKEFDISFVEHGSKDVYESYRLAERLEGLSTENSSAYRALGAVSAPDRTGGPSLTYVRAFLIDRTKAFHPEPEDEFDFVRLRKPLYGVLRQNETYGFPRGAWTLLVGRSGYGKTTILRLLVQEGRSREAVEHRSVTNHLRRFCLMQDLQLMDNLSVIDNVRIFSHRKEDAVRYLRMLRIPERRWHGHVDDLSGGEVQRVAIAQSLASQASLIILDEPLKGLDKPLRFALFEMFKEESNRYTTPSTMVCVDHDFEYIYPYFDYVYELISGYQFPIVTKGQSH